MIVIVLVAATELSIRHYRPGMARFVVLGLIAFEFVKDRLKNGFVVRRATTTRQRQVPNTKELVTPVNVTTSN